MIEILDLAIYQIISFLSILGASCVIGVYLVNKTDDFFIFVIAVIIGLAVAFTVVFLFSVEIEKIMDQDELERQQIRKQKEIEREQIRVAIEIADCQTLKKFYDDFHKSWREIIVNQYVIDCVQEKSEMLK